jgi:predicted Na+-dependent transporter
MYTYVMTLIFSPGDLIAVGMMIVSCCPGGVFSNVWCALFNSDLSLSVALTSFGTILSLGFLPLNMFIWVETVQASNAVKIDWISLVVTVVVVCLGVITGLGASKYLTNHRGKLNGFGAISGLVLAILAIIDSSSSNNPFYAQPSISYAAIITSVVGMTLVSYTVASIADRKLPMVSKLSIMVEIMYQNTSVAIALTYASFPYSVAREVVGTPILYTFVSSFWALIFLGIGWKMGYTYADRKVSLLQVLIGYYQPIEEGEEEANKPNTVAPNNETQSPADDVEKA